MSQLNFHGLVFFVFFFSQIFICVGGGNIFKMSFSELALDALVFLLAASAMEWLLAPHFPHFPCCFQYR